MLGLTFPRQSLVPYENGRKHDLLSLANMGLYRGCDDGSHLSGRNDSGSAKLAGLWNVPSWKTVTTVCWKNSLSARNTH